mmetsp:Transcript_7535/g.10968  ORF Transcript_7535/g.10968 Transcript_7535/m.10968 type:complete len:276 (-) Transcript_7535:381-1208(-)
MLAFLGSSISLEASDRSTCRSKVSTALDSLSDPEENSDAKLLSSGYSLVLQEEPSLPKSKTSDSSVDLIFFCIESCVTLDEGVGIRCFAACNKDPFLLAAAGCAIVRFEGVMLRGEVCLAFIPALALLRGEVCLVFIPALACSKASCTLRVFENTCVCRSQSSDSIESRDSPFKLSEVDARSGELYFSTLITHLFVFLPLRDDCEKTCVWRSQSFDSSIKSRLLFFTLLKSFSFSGEPTSTSSDFFIETRAASGKLNGCVLMLFISEEWEEDVSF